MICLDIHPNLLELFGRLKGFLNSAFVSAFLSALAGAGLGVWGAQRLAERASRRKELLAALRQSNALVVLAATIANQALSVKRQHVAPMWERYFEDRDSAETLNEFVLRGQDPPEPIRIQAELVKISPLTVPIDTLKSLTYSAELMPGKALALVSMVEQSLTELSNAIEIRDEQIERFKTARMPQDLFLQSYFGLQRADGNVDGMYRDAMTAISQYVDDVAFFSSELTSELQAHGERTSDLLKKETNNVPKVTKADFSAARESGLMPPRENYENWLAGFAS